MSFQDVLEGLLRPLKPDLYIGQKYQFSCRYGQESFRVTGIITNLVRNHNGQWWFTVTTKGFIECDVLALVHESNSTWLLHIKSGENFTQFIEGNFQLV